MFCLEQYRTELCQTVYGTKDNGYVVSRHEQRGESFPFNRKPRNRKSWSELDEYVVFHCALHRSSFFMTFHMAGWPTQAWPSEPASPTKPVRVPVPALPFRHTLGWGAAPVLQSTVSAPPDEMRGANTGASIVRAKRLPQQRQCVLVACVEARTGLRARLPTNSVVGKASPYRGAASCRGARKCVQAEGEATGGRSTFGEAHFVGSLAPGMAPRRTR